MGALYFTAGELIDRILYDRDHWVPDEFTLGHGLVYSSPATLAYNSPGAEGYGVKRAALTVPGSVELIISPGCCGRNTSDISELPGYENRFYYLELDEADIVTGRHLKRIPETVRRILADRRAMNLDRPEVVMLVTTCVDALLGTDMDRICRICEKECGLLVRPAYMYALTRDGVKPPMAAVRESIVSLLEKRDRNSSSANILGFCGGLEESSYDEIYEMLGATGITQLREVADCNGFEEFMHMSEASFNLVLDPDARAAASYMQKNLGSGYIELGRFYGIDRVMSQYKALLRAFNSSSDVPAKMYAKCRADIDRCRKRIDEAGITPVFSVGECANAHAPELALSLMEYGYRVTEIFATLSENDAYYIAEIADRDPQVKFFFNQHPSMIAYEPDDKTSFCIGKDASWYYRNRDVVSLDWNADRQPFGFTGIGELMKIIESRALGHVTEDYCTVDKNAKAEAVPVSDKQIHGYRRVLTPFAPDQSGAVSALYPLNSLTVIMDAGGCTGNICGFDEPRWISERALIFSAGIRDMDAILGQDRAIVKKIADAAEQLHPDFISLIGTPVPSTIGTDLTGLSRDIEKKTGLTVIAIDTNGIDLYDKGLKKAYKEIKKIKSYKSRKSPDNSSDSLGIFGLSPLDYDETERLEIINKLRVNGYSDLQIYGIDDYAGTVKHNIAFSVSGYEASDHSIAPAEIIVSDRVQQQAIRLSERPGTMLIIGEQIFSNALRSVIRKHSPEKKVSVAGFFTMIGSLMSDGDVRLKEEDDLPQLVADIRPSVIVGDPVLKRLLPSYDGEWISRAHFALSGRNVQER